MEFDERKPYAIASVIIKKNVSPEEALQHALNITKKKKLKMTETKNTYRFRNLPKTKFSDYLSKKINKNITLLFGELKPEFARLSGRGFLDYFRKGYISNAYPNVFSAEYTTCNAPSSDLCLS